MADSRLTIVTRLPNDILRAKVDSFVKSQKLEQPGYSMNTLVVDAIRAWIEPKDVAAPPVLAPRQQEPAPRQVAPKPKGWLSELQRLMRLREVDPEETGREESRMFQGFKPPKGWSYLDIEHRAAHLDANLPLDGMVTIQPDATTGITKQASPTTEKPARTLEQLMASGDIRRGIQNDPAPEPKQPATGTGTTADPDGW